jgi:hypothetical protein
VSDVREEGVRVRRDSLMTASSVYSGGGVIVEGGRARPSRESA